MKKAIIDDGFNSELVYDAEFETTDFYYVHISEERKKNEFNKVHENKSQGNNNHIKGKKFYTKRKIKVLKFA